MGAPMRALRREMDRLFFVTTGEAPPAKWTMMPVVTVEEWEAAAAVIG